MPSVAFRIDWMLPRRQFAAEIDKRIAEAVRNEAIIGTPAMLTSDTLPLVIQQLDCRCCRDSSCCKRSKIGYAAVSESEHNRLVESYGDKGFTASGELILPCRFLSKKGRCSIHEERPYSCFLYPIDMSVVSMGADGKRRPALGLHSRCPEGRRIAKLIWMTQWDAWHYSWSITDQDRKVMQEGMDREIREGLVQVPE